jgi:hypothetical protein
MEIHISSQTDQTAWRKSTPCSSSLAKEDTSPSTTLNVKLAIKIFSRIILPINYRFFYHTTLRFGMPMAKYNAITYLLRNLT